MTDDVPGRRPCHDFLAVLPLSDGMVTVRSMSAADADAYAAGTDDALVKRFAHLPLDKYTPQIACNLIEGAIAVGLRDGTLAVLAICDTPSNAFLGSLVFFDIKRHDAEIGFWVAPEHRGRNTGFRALMLAVDIACTLGLKKLRAKTVEENSASQRVLLKAGFEQSGGVCLEILPSGKNQMSVNYLLEL